MASNDLIPPLVVIVGGSVGSLSGWSEVVLSERDSQERSSSVSSDSSLQSAHTSRKRLSSCTAPTSCRAISRVSTEWMPSDNDGLRELCEKIESEKKLQQSSRANSDEIMAHGRRLREELRKTKHDLKEKAAALRSHEKTRSKLPSIFRSEVHPPEIHEDLTFEAMLNQDPPSASSAPDREDIQHQKLALKAHVKALKEEERARKETEKLEKVRLAVQARNDKIDAQREKAALKAAKKQAKAAYNQAQWELHAKAEAEQLWVVDNILSRSHIVRI